MSISFRKINGMIEEAVGESQDLSANDKRLLIDLCQKVYMIESSVEYTSRTQVINEIKGEVALAASAYGQEGGE